VDFLLAVGADHHAVEGAVDEEHADEEEDDREGDGDGCVDEAGFLT
jgi:hypothetical protein